jgi:hypothetical protein
VAWHPSTYRAMAREGMKSRASAVVEDAGGLALPIRKRKHDKVDSTPSPVKRTRRSSKAKFLATRRTEIARDSQCEVLLRRSPEFGSSESSARSIVHSYLLKISRSL